MDQKFYIFLRGLPNDEECKAYLSRLKWRSSFKCAKCGKKKGCLNKDYSYYCYACHHVESATANTIFHKVKFGLQIAFQVLAEVTKNTEKTSSVEIAKRYGISQPTAWYFIKKIQISMKSNRQWKYTKVLILDNFLIQAKRLTHKDVAKKVN